MDVALSVVALKEEASAPEILQLFSGCYRGRVPKDTCNSSAPGGNSFPIKSITALLCSGRGSPAKCNSSVPTEGGFPHQSLAGGGFTLGKLH